MLRSRSWKLVAALSTLGLWFSANNASAADSKASVASKVLAKTTVGNPKLQSIDAIRFASNANGVPGFVDPPQAFTVEPGKTKINPGLDRAIATMRPGERRSVIVPAELAYGRSGLYPPETPGKRRFVISPYAMLVYDVEVLPNE